jgi:hypothetical protein
MDDDQAALIDEETAPPATGDPQPALIPMTEDELREAGRKLANLVQDLATMTAAHALQRTEQATERKELRERIDNVAQSIRQQGR